MASTILGLLTTDKIRAQGDYLGSRRRKVIELVQPNGFSLAGLTALVPVEALSSTELYWHETRHTLPSVVTRGTAPLTKTAPSTGDANDGTASDNTSVGSVGTSNYLKVASTVNFRVGQVITVKPTGANEQWRVIGVTRGVADEALLGYLTLRPVRALASYTAANYAAGELVAIIGDAHGQGGSSTAGLGYKRPIELKNTTQILRTRLELPYETIADGSLIYDKAGLAPSRKRQAAIEHFGMMDACMLFGKRSANSSGYTLSASDSDMTVEFVSTMGGVFEQMKLYDAGSTGLTINGATYAPYSHKSIITDDKDSRKRFLTGDGTVSFDLLEDWHVRACATVARATPDRLVITSNKVMRAINKLARKSTNQDLTPTDTDYGFQVRNVVTAVGTLHFVTHPLWNDPNNTYGLQDSMLICDPTSWKLRPLIDTTFRENIQPADKLTRWDEWLTEMSMEFFGIESNVFIGNCSTFAADI